ncbi:hypothetical protein [Neobacillus sp. YIM B06451]|uniref:hypothetical protein n=1 Tax=Neobacillus sp. YIM B06451 TaxID=3070994 RepID=UPI002930B026|nr:hypothetical protein [Neobacillus sp. YIM B06451]
MPQYLVTYIKKGEAKTRTKKLSGDRISDIYELVFEIEKKHTIVAIENTTLNK